jgi:hypothetical protein
LPAPISDLDPAFIDIFFNFANTYTEDSVLHSEVKRRKNRETAPTEERFRKMGYSEEEIANMDLDE